MEVRELQLPQSSPDIQTFTQEKFDKGVITVINESRLPKNALKRGKNITLVEDGSPTIRPGVGWYGSEITVTIVGSYASPDTASGTNWTNPTNVTASDNSRAVYANTAQNDLFITDFDFEIPTTATILGVTVQVEGNGTDATAGNRSIEVGMTKDGAALAGSRLAAQNLNQTTDTTLTFGSTSNLFSTTLTPAQANASTFGIMLRAGNTNAGARNIDHVTVRITYSNAEAIDGASMYEAANGDIHLVAIAGGGVARSTNNGSTWTACLTGSENPTTLTPGKKVSFEQAVPTGSSANRLYMANGEENIIYYDGTTSLQSYSALATPTGNTPTKTGLAATTYTLRYRVAAVNEVGVTAASTATTIGVSRTRDGFDASNFVTFTWSAVSGAVRYDVFVGLTADQELYIDSIAGTTYIDQGNALENPFYVAPTDDTSAGPKVGDIELIGNKLWATKDKDHEYRVWFTGSNKDLGAFATGVGGGYADLQEGSQFKPVKVEDYHSGRGDAVTQIWCDSADGLGCVWQLFLRDDISGPTGFTIIAPVGQKLPGSRGTNAPFSVINVLNDYIYYNSQAFYNLGARAQYLNLLSTDEASSDIRPTVKQIRSTASNGIAGIYEDGKVYYSVPYNSDTNNATIVYNTEIRGKPWMPEAFMIGFERFLRYTDTSGGRHLLAWKPGDTRLSQISPSIKGDYGEPFDTELVTGLIYPLGRFEFLFVEEGEVELSEPAGVIFMELAGIERTKGFRTVKTTRNGFTFHSGIGWDTFGWDTMGYDDTSQTADVTAEVSAKRYFPAQKELNAYRYRLTTDSLEANYILRTLQVNGTPTEAGKPRSWRLRPE